MLETKAKLGKMVMIGFVSVQTVRTKHHSVEGKMGLLRNFDRESVFVVCDGCEIFKVRSLDIGMDETGFRTEYLDDGGELVNNVHEGALVRPEDVMEMLFNSPNKTSSFYEQYSRGKDFAMRVNKKLRNKNGGIM
ncbi:hypothetical protein AHAS_Ahas12G0152500 [Arachis hypogaea]